jgi:hypothetical protein
MTTETSKATTRAPSQRTGPGGAEATRTVVMAPGVELDEHTTFALTELRDRQGANLPARQRTEMALRRATQGTFRPEAPDGPVPTPIDTTHLNELVEWPKVTGLDEPPTLSRSASSAR